MKYKNIGGAHTLRDEKTGTDGITVPRGKAFESDDENLIEKFPNKFERVNEEDLEVVNAPEASDKAPVADEKKKSDDEDPKKKKPSKDPLDVSEDYPLAEEAGVKVFKIKKGWWVHEIDEDGVVDEEPAHEKALKKKEVDDFIKELSEDDDQE